MVWVIHFHISKNSNNIGRDDIILKTKCFKEQLHDWIFNFCPIINEPAILEEVSNKQYVYGTSEAVF